MSGPVQKSQYPSQERAVIGGAAPQKSLILTENGPFPQNFGACGGLGAGAPRRRHTSPAAARPSETGVVQPPRSDRENLLVRGLVLLSVLRVGALTPPSQYSSNRRLYAGWLLPTLTATPRS